MNLSIRDAKFSLDEGLGNIRALHYGKYRDVYHCKQFVVKFLKPYMRKLGLPIPTSWYTLMKYGLKDLHKYEYKNSIRVRDSLPDLRDNFARIIEVRKIAGKNASVSEAVLNQDGSLAPSLRAFGTVDDEGFWRQMDTIEDALLEQNIPLLDIQPGNFVVQQTDTEVKPVFIDYKRLGVRMYHYQFGLRGRDGIKHKIQRRFNRLRDRFQV